MWNNGQGWQAYGDLNLRTGYQSDLDASAPLSDRTNQKYPDRAYLAYHTERSVAVSPMAILYLEF